LNQTVFFAYKKSVFFLNHQFPYLTFLPKTLTHAPFKVFYMIERPLWEA